MRKFKKPSKKRGPVRAKKVSYDGINFASGLEKYGRTLDSERTGGHKNLFGYLNDVQEELMDAILYLQAAKEELSDLAEDAELKRINVIAQNGNDGEHYKQGPCACHDKETEDA
jgi:hypothetical protein